MIDEVLEDIKRHLDYVKATNQFSIRDNEIKVMYEEIERLNKELKSLQDSYDIEEEQANYHIDLTDDLREEVDRLNKELKCSEREKSDLLKTIDNLELREKRLNNIINELEKWLQEKQFERIDNVGIYALYETVLQKLQELKEK